MGKRKQSRKASRNPKRRVIEASSEASEFPEQNEMNATDTVPWCENSIHPLLIDHVLENVFNNMIGPNAKCPEGITEEEHKRKCIKDLCNLRLVSKQWKEISSKLLGKEKDPIPFGESFPIKSDDDYYDHDKKMDEFLQTMKNSQMFPVQRFFLGPHFFKHENRELMNEFIRICGPTMVELRLCFNNFSTMGFSRRCFPNLKLEKLRKLVFISKQFSCSVCLLSPLKVTIPWLAGILLCAAPILQEFTFEVPILDANWHAGLLACQRFDEIVCKQIPTTVKVLQLNLPLFENHLRTLIGKNLKLEELNFNTRFVAGAEVLQNFLVQQSPSLSTLKFSSSHIVPIKFPLMHQLTCLEIEEARIEPFWFKYIFPKLTVLNLRRCRGEIALVKDSSGISSETVKEIYFPLYAIQVAPLVSTVSQCFPNLKSVHFHFYTGLATAEALAATFLHFTTIEELHLTFLYVCGNTGTSRSVEAMLAGISEEEYYQIVNVKNPNFDQVNIDDVHTPAITNLTHLKKLVVKGVWRNSIFTDFGVHFIFLKMKSLIELHTNKFQMSSKYKKLLTEKITLKEFQE